MQDNLNQNDWRWQVKNTLRTPEQFADFFGWDSNVLEKIRAVASVYPMQTTRFYASLAHSAALDDPVVAQCTARPAELEDTNEHLDPLGEENSSPLPRLIHRYTDRALFLTCGACAVHCRHCMRKRMWGSIMPPPSDIELDKAVQYLAGKPEIRELLISGGDPLMLEDREIKKVIDAFNRVPNIEMLRIGTRTPVALPQRFTPELCEILGSSNKTIWIATHFNHPFELSREAETAVRRLMAAGVSVVNQSVLLKGINDNAEILGKLFTKLLAMRIKPYYLFHGDPIKGTTCFRTGIQAGLDIMEKLRRSISGMAVPAYAFDLPSGGGKIRLEPDFSAQPLPDGTPVYKRFDRGTEPYR